MNSPVLGLRIASAVFGLVCLAHLARLLMRLEVVIGKQSFDMWWSGVALVVTALLCVWLWRLSGFVKAPTAQSERVAPHHTTAATP